MDRLIFHVDVNSAFLSWEATRRVANGEEDLRLVPSAVGGDPASRRSIIAAKSIPAKKYGINTGEPVSMALRKCPSLIVVKPDFALYKECSKAFIAICREYAPKLEQFSIDECFLDMTGTSLIYPDPIATAHEIKDKIRDTLGFTVNIGIGSNKLLAKMASDFQKPDRVHTLFYDEIESKMWPLPVGDLFLAGKASTDKLIKSGFKTIGDVARADIEDIKLAVGSGMGGTLYAFANGRDDSEVNEEREDAKSYSMSNTLEENVISTQQAYPILRSLSDNVGYRIRHDNVMTSCVGVTIRNTDFVDRSHQRKLDEPTDISSEIYEVAVSLFNELWDRHTPLRLINVSLSDISKENEPYQISLFRNEQKEKARKVDRALDSLQNKFGKGAVMRGSAYIKNRNEEQTNQD